MLVSILIVPAALVRDNVTSARMLAGAICGLAFAGPNSWLLTQSVCPKELGATASGVQNFSGNLGGIIAPALTGLIAHRTGSSVPAFIIGGLILLCGEPRIG